MVDYFKSTGTSGTMLIRDLGENVEFWLNSNNSTTWSDRLPWSIIVNGVNSGNLTYNYQPGAGWRKLTTQYIGYSQTVTFKLGNTGTSGFGGPTTFNQWINRAAVPPAPTTPTLSEITPTSMKAIFWSQGTGVGTFIRWELGYGTNPDNPVTIIESTGTSVVTGLASGTTYYFWARGVNTTGTGPWSGRGSASTPGAPGINSAPTLLGITQTTATLKLNPGGDGGNPINLYQFSWSYQSSGNPTSTVSVIPTGGLPPTTMTGLPPGTTLYFRSRTKNDIGWSAWGGVTVGRTTAGARVKVGFVYKDAVPYVKVAGVWKLASSWVKQTGIWKETR